MLPIEILATGLVDGSESRLNRELWHQTAPRSILCTLQMHTC